MPRYKTRRYLVLGALIVLPLLMLGVAPALEVLIQRIFALEGQVEIVEGEPQMVKEQAEILEAELGADRVRVFDANGVEIGRLIDVSISGGVTIYLEELAVIARFSTTGNLTYNVGALHYAQIDCQGPTFLVPGPIVANVLQNGINDLFLVISRGEIVEIPLASVLGGSGCQNRGEPFNIEPAVAAELIFDPAEIGLSIPLSVPFIVAPAAAGP